MSGFFGVVSKNDCVRTLFYGTDYHSHMGTQFGGVAVHGKTFQRQIHDISRSQFKSKFHDDCMRMSGTKGVGVISDNDEQPIYVNSRFGSFCIVTSGLIGNSEALAEELKKQGVSFSEMSTGEVNTTELIAKLITRGKNIVDGIERMFSEIEGSCSLLMLTEQGIYAARDRLGYTPVVLGRGEDSWALTSETSAFANNAFQQVKFLRPGEIIFLNEHGPVTEHEGNGQEQACAFLWIYAGFPASSYDGINVELARERCGRALARRDWDMETDLVAGVPDSGVGHALGYAAESGKPLRRPLVKYTPGYGRSYTPPSQTTRDLIATMKLVPVKDVIEGNRIVLCEDSIVRGTQLKNYTVNKLWDCGAEQIHVRVACPPLMFPCKFCISTRSIEELAARKAIKDIEKDASRDTEAYTDSESPKYKDMVDWIRRDLDVTTLRYQTLQDMIEAIGMPEEKLCTYCWTGKTLGESACGKKTKKCGEGADEVKKI